MKFVNVTIGLEIPEYCDFNGMYVAEILPAIFRCGSIKAILDHEFERAFVKERNKGVQSSQAAYAEWKKEHENENEKANVQARKPKDVPASHRNAKSEPQSKA